MLHELNPSLPLGQTGSIFSVSVSARRKIECPRAAGHEVRERGRQDSFEPGGNATGSGHLQTQSGSEWSPNTCRSQAADVVSTSRPSISVFQVCSECKVFFLRAQSSAQITGGLN